MKKLILPLLLLLNVFMVTAQETDSIFDIRDGQIYKIVKIGQQWWMAENLRSTIYINNTMIPLVTDNDEWGTLTTPAYCWYNNDEEANKNIYGALYNWYTIETEKLCPIGWHVPTDIELATLETYLGGSNIAGGKLKEANTSHWQSPNTGATNETGFKAVPGGCRGDYATFYYLGTHGTWWSSTKYDSVNSRTFNLYYDSTNSSIIHHQNQIGFSVRCVKDPSFRADSLIAYYPFNGNANDESENGYHGIVYGATLKANRFGNDSSAFSFDGIDDYIEIGTLPKLTANYNSFSLSFWINSGSDVSQLSSIMRSVNNASYGMTFGLDFHRNGSQFQLGRLSFDTRSNDSKFFSFAVNAPEIFDNQWHQIVYNFEDIGNNKASVYIDGKLANITYGTIQGPTDYSQFDNPFVLGAGNNRGVIEKFYKGSLDEFRICSHILTESEIDSLYHERGFVSLMTNINQISCIGSADGSIELNAIDGMNAYRFNWSTGDIESFVDSLAPGEYSVIITDTNDSRVRFESFLITEPLPITINSLYHNIITCFGDNTGIINLTAIGGTGNLLYSLSDSSSWQDFGYFTGLFAGKYFVSVMDEKNCKIYTDTIIIDQNDKLPALNIVGKTEVDEYEQTIYSVNLIPGLQYEWFSTGGNIIEGHNTNAVNVHWATTGIGKIGVIQNTFEGCRLDTAWISVNIGGLFNNSINQEELKIFPNPLTHQTTIQFPNPANEKFQLKVFNLEGQIVKIVDDIYSSKVVISKEYLQKGYYHIELRGSKLYIGKLLVQ